LLIQTFPFAVLAVDVDIPHIIESGENKKGEKWVEVKEEKMMKFSFFEVYSFSQ